MRSGGAYEVRWLTGAGPIGARLGVGDGQIGFNPRSKESKTGVKWVADHVSR